jgi:outer membrane protein assembly factor BamB
MVKTACALAVLLIVAGVWHVAAQPQGGPPQGGMGGFPGGMGGFPGGPPMMGPMMMPAPMAVVVVGDGVVYVACDGKLTAFDAKTLEKLAEATYWERPEPPQRPNQ